MSKQIYPLLPKSGVLYDDDAAKPAEIDFNHLESSFRLADLLKELGHQDAATLARPVHMIAGFKPAALVERLNDVAAGWDRACIACINADRLPEIIWHPCPNAVNQLVKLRLAGGHVLGFIGLNRDGSFSTSTESGPDQELRVSLLNTFASVYATTPSYLAAEEILSLNKPENFTPDNLRKTLDSYTDISERYPTDIHAEITGAK